jgi:hypothetical protein
MRPKAFSKKQNEEGGLLNDLAQIAPVIMVIVLVLELKSAQTPN